MPAKSWCTACGGLGFRLRPRNLSWSGLSPCTLPGYLCHPTLDKWGEVVLWLHIYCFLTRRQWCFTGYRVKPNWEDSEVTAVSIVQNQARREQLRASGELAWERHSMSGQPLTPAQWKVRIRWELPPRWFFLSTFSMTYMLRHFVWPNESLPTQSLSRMMGWSLGWMVTLHVFSECTHCVEGN